MSSIFRFQRDLLTNLLLIYNFTLLSSSQLTIIPVTPHTFAQLCGEEKYGTLSSNQVQHNSKK